MLHHDLYDVASFRLFVKIDMRMLMCSEQSLICISHECLKKLL